MFHPLVQQWFLGRFRAPTPPQRDGWPQIAAGRHTLIAAPTGSGKTLTAFLWAIDRLIRAAEAGELRDELQVVYVSPLRALSNDMHRNLEEPLAEIVALARSQGLELPPIRAGLRTGDTPASARAALIKRPPHILVTTPESLYLLMTSARGRERMPSVETVIVDEIHSLVRDKRGSHLGLTLERLAALCPQPPQRIGLSATQRPMERIAEFLVGALPTDEDEQVGNRLHNAVAIVDTGHQRDLDLAIEAPPSELGPVCMHEQWAEINARVCELINSHRSTLVFVNNRRMAERVAHQLSEMLGPDAVSSHHGSLAADMRLDTEQRLKHGQLKAVVATASLELGLDIGYIDLVIQLGSPRSIAVFLQRVGRSGHALGLTPKGRLFALTRDELIECLALMRAIRAGRLDVVPIPEAPLDVLAQQIVAEVAAREWDTDDLFALVRRAYSYRTLKRTEFDAVIDFLAEGISRTDGRGRAHLHHDRVGRRLRARPGARIAAVMNGGAIPEVASYRVVAEPEHTVVGTLDEDFASESQAGEIFLLGNTSWRIQHVRGNDVTVTDAQGAPPSIPFWRGEAPGRTLELSEEVSRLREDLEPRLGDPAAATRWLGVECFGSHVESAAATPLDPTRPSESPPPYEGGGRGGLVGYASDSEGSELSGSSPTARSRDGDLRNEHVENVLHGSQPTSTEAPPPDPPLRKGGESDDGGDPKRSQADITAWALQQAVEYAAAQQAAIGLLPTQKRVVFERFFDESGGMQLVIHAPFGSRICKAWGLAMRKRFCRSFDFELQANADDDGIVLSLGPQHSFPLESMFHMLNPQNAQPLLEQALLQVPTFQTRWRWNVIRALMVLKFRNGKKVPPGLLRMRADDLLTAVFPKLTGCQENVVGDIELPDHPLCRQSMHDSLTEPCDVDGLKDVLQQIAAGRIELIARDTREPSPFSYELLNANPYAFLDGGEIAERRTRAVATRRSLTVESVSDLGRLDPAAIEQVRADAQPLVRSPDELYDVLLSRIVLPAAEALPQWREFFDSLVAQRRATTAARYWAAAERWPAVQAAFPDVSPQPPIEVPEGVRTEWTGEDARVAMVRGLIEVSGPILAADVANRLGITQSQAEAGLMYLEGEGVVLRGRFTPPPSSFVVPALGGDAAATEWCHRRLLARIHRLTIEGLRKQIEPVTVDVFVRFLLRHHGLAAGHRRSGTNGLYEIVSMLQGIDVPAVSWERDLLPARLEKYRPEVLDELCLTGEIGWGRLFPVRRLPDRPRPMAGVTRVVPISLFLREDAAWLVPPAEPQSLSSAAQEVHLLLQRQGAMFAADLLTDTRLLPAQLNEALGELVSQGLVTADGFAGLRNLLAERTSESRTVTDRIRRGALRRRAPLAGSGRWSLWRRGDGKRATPIEARHPEDAGLRAEEWAWQLLRRWGVVFRDLLEREDGAPRWFELLQVLRRLEARGEVRGGRFIAGVAGEQFALGDTVKRLRQLRDVGPQQELAIVSAADPLNLVGILTPQPRVPRTAGNRVAWLDGNPVAALVAGEIRWLAAPDHAIETRLRGMREPVDDDLPSPVAEETYQQRSLFPA